MKVEMLKNWRCFFIDRDGERGKEKERIDGRIAKTAHPNLLLRGVERVNHEKLRTYWGSSWETHRIAAAATASPLECRIYRRVRRRIHIGVIPSSTNAY